MGVKGAQSDLEPDDLVGEVHTLVVAEGDSQRLDVFISERLELSRTRVQKLLGDGHITVDGRLGKKSEIVEAGRAIAVRVPPAESVEIGAEDLPLDIVYQDDSLVVVNKASCTPHPGIAAVRWSMRSCGTSRRLKALEDAHAQVSSTGWTVTRRVFSSWPRRTTHIRRCPTH